jgi:hypothetical protein
MLEQNATSDFKFGSNRPTQLKVIPVSVIWLPSCHGLYLHENAGFWVESVSGCTASLSEKRCIRREIAGHT